MTGDDIFQLFAYLLPAVVTGAVAFYFFRLHTNNEEGRRRFLLHKESQKSSLPIRLQAYERITRLGRAVLVPDGILVSSSCSSRVTAAMFFGAVHRATRREGRTLLEIERTGHAPDHPIRFSEGAYLKALFARAL